MEGAAGCIKTSRPSNFKQHINKRVMSEITATTSGFLTVLGRYRVDAMTPGAVGQQRCTYRMTEETV